MTITPTQREEVVAAIAHDVVRDWLAGCSEEAMPQIRFEQSELLQHLIASALLSSEAEANARAERAEGENKRLREALKPFVEYSDGYFDDATPDQKESHGWSFRVGDFRRARVALKEPSDGE